MQLEEFKKEQEGKLEKEVALKMAETVKRMAVEEKLETSYREMRKYQDTLQQSQEQLEGTQGMIEDSQVCEQYRLSAYALLLFRISK